MLLYFSHLNVFTLRCSVAVFFSFLFSFFFLLGFRVRFTPFCHQHHRHHDHHHRGRRLSSCRSSPMLNQSFRRQCLALSFQTHPHTHTHIAIPATTTATATAICFISFIFFCCCCIFFFIVFFARCHYMLSHPVSQPASPPSIHSHKNREMS